MSRLTRNTHPSGVLSLLLLTGACSAAQTAGTAATASSSSSPAASSAVAGATAAETLAANATAVAADADYDESQVVDITLSGTSASTSSNAVTVSGSTVTITAAGTYRLTGSLTDGQVVVNSTGDGTVRLILDGVSISSSSTSPLVITDAEDAVVELADGSQNTLNDATSYVYPDADTDEPNAALFSTADLTITGSGALTVNGNANDGITSKDGLVIESGTITVTAVDDGIRGKDYLAIYGGTITVTAGGDGLKSDNEEDTTKGYVSIAGGTLAVTAAGDGIDAVTDVVVTAGDLTLNSGGGSDATLAADASSAKGIKGAVSVVIEGGQIAINSADDAVHSNGTVTINGGSITAATGDDGIHADADVTIKAGTVDITRSNEGVEGMTVTIDGGNLTVNSSDDGINVAGGGLSRNRRGRYGRRRGGQRCQPADHQRGHDRRQRRWRWVGLQRECHHHRRQHRGERSDGQRQRRARRERHLHHLRRHTAGGRQLRNGGGPGGLVRPGLGRRDVQLGAAGRHGGAHRRGGRDGDRLVHRQQVVLLRGLFLGRDHQRRNLFRLHRGIDRRWDTGRDVHRGHGTDRRDDGWRRGMGGGTPPAGGRPGG